MTDLTEAEKAEPRVSDEWLVRNQDCHERDYEYENRTGNACGWTAKLALDCRDHRATIIKLRSAHDTLTARLAEVEQERDEHVKHVAELIGLHREQMLAERWSGAGITEAALLAGCKVWNGKLFSDDPAEAHRAASPMSVEYARQQVRRLVEGVLRAALVVIRNESGVTLAEVRGLEMAAEICETFRVGAKAAYQTSSDVNWRIMCAAAQRSHEAARNAIRAVADAHRLGALDNIEDVMAAVAAGRSGS